MTHQDPLLDLLHKTSRTFAVTIPLLPEPVRREVGVAYLMFRIIDTFEDATLWPPVKRMQVLREFIDLMQRPSAARLQDAAQAWLREPPLSHDGYLALIAQTDSVLAWQQDLRDEAREIIHRHIVRTAQGMIEFVGRTNAAGTLQLDTLQELRDYCFVVAGIVGQLLTELYLLGCPQLQPVANELRARAVRFGEGLQLVNILKDAQPDAEEGRWYLPRDLTLDAVFDLAHEDLVVALEYTELLRSAQADLGVVAFNAMNARLAFATLSALRNHGLGSKLTRAELTGLASEVLQSVHAGDSLFPSSST